MTARIANAKTLMLGMLFLAGMAVIAMMLLNSMATVQVSTNTVGVVHMLHKGPSSIRSGLEIHEHCLEHQYEKMNAMETYKMLLAGECAMVARYCDEYDPNKELHLCLDPVSQLIGGIYVVGNLIEGGHASDGKKWWSKELRQDENWWNRDGTGKFSICPDGILR